MASSPGQIVQPLPVILSGARNPRAALSHVSESQVSPSHFRSAVLLSSPVFFFFFLIHLVTIEM